MTTPLISSACRPRRREGVTVRLGSARPTLVQLSGSVVCELNETAFALWELCDGSTSPAEMVDSVCELFRTVREIVIEDVDRTLRDLTFAGVLDWVPTQEETIG